jgi:hypothetical protein
VSSVKAPVKNRLDQLTPLPYLFSPPPPPHTHLLPTVQVEDGGNKHGLGRTALHRQMRKGWRSHWLALRSGGRGGGRQRPSWLVLVAVRTGTGTGSDSQLEIKDEVVCLIQLAPAPLMDYAVHHLAFLLRHPSHRSHMRQPQWEAGYSSTFHFSNHWQTKKIPNLREKLHRITCVFFSSPLFSSQCCVRLSFGKVHNHLFF